MSFTATARTVFRSDDGRGTDLGLLERAAATLGLTLDRDARAYRSHDGPRRCDMALRDAHGCTRDVGLIRRTDAATGEVFFAAAWDPYAVSGLAGGDALLARVGRDLGLLGQAYNRLAVPRNLALHLAPDGDFTYEDAVLDSGDVVGVFEFEVAESAADYVTA